MPILFLKAVMVKLKELKTELGFYSEFLIILLPNRISVLVMPDDYPVYFKISLPNEQ